MMTPIIVWSCVIAALGIMLLIKLIHAVSASHQSHRRLIEIGTEREEFFIPGDRLSDDDDDCNEID